MNAYDTMPAPDWAMTTTISGVPSGPDARAWAEAIFERRSMPSLVVALFGLRELAARVLRIPPGDPAMLAVDRVVGDEAIIDTDDAHLHFVAGVRPDPDLGLLHVTTLVRFKGGRGRLYFLPVRLLHDPITRAMMHRAARRLAQEG
jgi:hypothetical protein